MLKKINIIIGIIVTVFLLNGCSVQNNGQGVSYENELVLEDIQNKIIRFHVLANSDTKEDQELKLKVRDKVIKEMSSKLIGCKNEEDARKIILKNVDEVNYIAKQVINENGYNYSVKSELSRENFPDKMYGDMLFPQGNYEAFRILIGEASGQNWWCVMFPPLCFVDESKQAVNADETKTNLDKIVSKKDNVNNEDNLNSKVKFKFKLWELFSKK